MSPASTPSPPEYSGSDSCIPYSAQTKTTGRSTDTPGGTGVSRRGVARNRSSASWARMRSAPSAAARERASPSASISSRTGLCPHTRQRSGSTAEKTWPPPTDHVHP